MSDYAMLSLFFSFFLTAFVLSVVLALTEATTLTREKIAEKKNTLK